VTNEFRVTNRLHWTFAGNGAVMAYRAQCEAANEAA